MQTFLPYSGFALSLRCLDNKRLGKQRVEAKQIIDILEGRAKSNAWKHHPAVLMWKGYEQALRLYYNEALHEWMSRGFKNNMQFLSVDFNCEFPHWLDNTEFHSRHRAKLLGKNYEWYKQFGWTELPLPKDAKYIWPV